jgi:DNA-binding transcriptional regulator YhcF (GntR family)
MISGRARGKRRSMMIEIDFNSEEALYLQLCNQIILGIASSRFQEGDSLPSVRQLADTIGINMHTVNKAYTVLKQEGYVKVDRRKGAVVAIDVDRIRALEELRRELQVILAKSSCRNISKEVIHELIEEIYQDFS